MRALLLALAVTLLMEIASLLVALVDEAERWLRRCKRPRRSS
jgi:hypothetical protein